MMIAVILLATGLTAFMQHASYPAGSLKPDTEAPGGFGTSDNFPSEFLPGRYTGLYNLQRDGDKVTISIANTTKSDLWFRAADGQLIIWLEAKQGGEWKPIQWHYWITCGNSYHRVVLPPQHVFAYQPVIPTGSLATEIRLATYTSEKGTTSEPVYSAAIKTTIDPNIFRLDPAKHPNEEVTTDWKTPTRRPKAGPIPPQTELAR